jgi:hypothetical protein
MAELHTLPDGRDVVITDIPDYPLSGVTAYRAYLADDPAVCAVAVTADGAMDALAGDERC